MTAGSRPTTASSIHQMTSPAGAAASHWSSSISRTMTPSSNAFRPATTPTIPRSTRPSPRARTAARSSSRPSCPRSALRDPSPRPRGHLPGVHAVEELAAAVIGTWPGVLAQHALVDVRAPSGGVGEPDRAVADHRRLRDERALPRHVVDVDLHDAHVGEHGAEMQRMEVREMAVVVVRGDVDLARLGQPPDLHRL